MIIATDSPDSFHDAPAESRPPFWLRLLKAGIGALGTYLIQALCWVLVAWGNHTLAVEKVSFVEGLVRHGFNNPLQGLQVLTSLMVGMGYLLSDLRREHQASFRDFCARTQENWDRFLGNSELVVIRQRISDFSQEHIDLASEIIGPEDHDSGPLSEILALDSTCPSDWGRRACWVIWRFRPVGQ